MSRGAGDGSACGQCRAGREPAIDSGGSASRPDSNVGVFP